MKRFIAKKLLAWKDDILRESKGTVVNLKAETENHPDLVDRASSESDRALELRTRDRQRKLISKIDDALRRQVLSGGAFETALFEAGAQLPERECLRFLEKASGLRGLISMALR